MELRRELEDYRKLFEQASSIILRFAPDGTIRYMNPAGLEFFGYTERELRGRHLVGSIVPATDSSGRDLAAMIRELTADPDRYTRNQNENLRSDGSRVWIAWANRGLFDDNGRLVEVLAIGNVISDRRRAEQQLQESRRMLRLVLDTIPVRVFWKDTSLRYLGCNRPFALDAGLHSPEELVGRTDYEMGWVEQAEMYRGDDRQVIETGESKLQYEEPQTTPTGELIWLRTSKFPLRDASGEIAGVLGTYEDITEHRRAEGALRRAKEEWERTFDAVPDLITILDAQHCILRVNRAMADRLGLAPEACWGRHCHELVHGLELPVPDCPHVLTMKDREQHSTELSLDKLGGHFVVTTVPLHDEAGGLLGSVHVMRDVTESRRAEAERSRLEQQMQHTQKLESLGVLAGGIAHDFNNLLMAILGYTELTLAGLPPDSAAREDVKEIETAARRAAELTRQMLAYSGKGRFEIRSLDLNDLVREMGDILQISVSKKASLRFQPAAALPAVEADPAQLRQVVMNLIVNASEAIGEEGGTVTVSTGLLEADAAYLADAWPQENLPQGRYVYLEVSDTGCGIEPRHLSRIFDPFFTTKFTGRGLGLAAVQGIVRGHRGTIKVSSAPGKRTVFRVLLPASTREVQTPANDEASAPSWRGWGTALLADDDEAVRDVAGRMLRSLGFDVVMAADGREALQALRDAAGRFTCVLLDLTMPNMDGEQTLKAIRLEDAALPVLIASGYDETVVARRLGADRRTAFIQKPYELPMLAARLQQILQPL